MYVPDLSDVFRSAHPSVTAPALRAVDATLCGHRKPSGEWPCAEAKRARKWHPCKENACPCVSLPILSIAHAATLQAQRHSFRRHPCRPPAQNCAGAPRITESLRHGHRARPLAPLHDRRHPLARPRPRPRSPPQQSGAPRHAPRHRGGGARRAPRTQRRATRR